MQKIVNIIAIASGVVSLTVVGVGGYVYVNQDSIIESVKQKALGSLGGLGGALGGGAIDGAVDFDLPISQPPVGTSPLPVPNSPL
tara:strand:+ start:198 stop:452 length:255 start_codon:yes stop_codon:yes gene_type:complete